MMVAVVVAVVVVKVTLPKPKEIMVSRCSSYVAFHLHHHYHHYHHLSLFSKQKKVTSRQCPEFESPVKHHLFFCETVCLFVCVCFIDLSQFISYKKSSHISSSHWPPVPSPSPSPSNHSNQPGCSFSFVFLLVLFLLVGGFFLFAFVAASSAGATQTTADRTKFLGGEEKVSER